MESRLTTIPTAEEAAQLAGHSDMSCEMRDLAAVDAIGHPSSPPVRPSCVHLWFEVQAERSPHAVAVSTVHESLTFRSLNAKANQLARRLRLLGVGPDVLVGLCVDRSLDVMITLLGILKAGGAYVPLDPALPPQRFDFILRDVSAPLVLTQRSHRSHSGLASTSNLQVLEDLMESSRNEAESNLDNCNSPDDLAYVMYTSGTTGRPNGVMIPHRGIVRLVIQPNYVSIVPADVFLQLAPLAFDASTFEIWAPLLNGARLVLYPSGPLSYSELSHFIDHHGITILWLTAALFHEMVDHAPATLGGVRQLLAGGDMLSPAKVRCYLELPRHGRLINGYGPTENTTFTCCAALDHAEEVGHSVTIGKPINGTEVYLLDQEGESVPTGVTGELFTGGDGLARGYLGNPHLTAEKFIPNPFRSEPGARMYRTGDVARWCEGGNLEFLGRRDHQVKIRGHRVELQEVEAVLGSHPDISRCAIILEQTASGDKSLAAFVVCRPQTDPVSSGPSWQRWLEERLPAPMIPSRWVELKSLPLNLNGKLDRQALARLAETEEATSTEYHPPRTATECALVEIWQAVLRRDRVGIRDDFIQLGGHSLLAAAMVTRVSEQFQKQVPLRWAFEHRTVESFAARLTSPNQISDLDLIPRAERVAHFPMSHAQFRMWLLHQTLPDAATYNQPVAYRISGRVDRGRIRQVLQDMLGYHEILRTSLIQENGALFQRVVLAHEVSLPWSEIDLSSTELHEQPSALNQCLLTEARRSFDLAQAPLWRTVWINLSDTEHVLLTTFHHSIVDEWSLRLFYPEVARRYAGTQPSPDGRGVHYADYAVWERHFLASESLEQQRAFWRQQLTPPPPAIAFPQSLPVSRTRSGKGDTYTFRLQPPVTQALRKFAQAEDATLFCLMLALCHAWIYQLTGQSDLTIGTPVADRKRQEVQSTLGFFLNTLPIRANVDDTHGFRQILRRVRHTLLCALANTDLPFEQMFEWVSQDREPGRHPLHQVMFVLLEEGLPSLQLGDALAQPMSVVTTQTSKCDLTLSILATGDSWECQAEFPLDLFDRTAIVQMCDHFVSLAKAIIEDPERPMVQRIFATPPESESIPNSEAASLHERSPRPPGAVEKPAPGTKPRDALEEQLIRIWRSILPKERVGIHDDFFHLGGHSLLAARIFAEIERTLQVRLPLATLLQNPTVAKLSALIRQGPNAAHWRALVPISAAGSRRPLFLVHGLGGNILSYQPLARFLDRHQPVYGLQAIGLNGLTPPLTTVESMAARYAQQIVEAYPSGPYHLGGMSMGGIIAYEIAQQFQRAGREVGLVLLLDSIPAQPVALLPRRNRLQHQLRTATARIHRQVTEAFRTPAQRWPELIRHKARLAWRLAHDYPDRSDLARNNLAAFRRYSPTRYPGNITLVNAQTHHRADKDLFRAAWGQLASSLSYHEVPGDHVSFMEEPHVKHTAEVVRDCLNADAHHRQNPVSSSVA